MIDLSRFKVIYKEKVWRTVYMDLPIFESSAMPGENHIVKPTFLQVWAINEDGNIVCLTDEAWMFQFVPVVGGAVNG